MAPPAPPVMPRRPERIGAISRKRGGPLKATIPVRAHWPAPFRLRRCRSPAARPACPAPTTRRNYAPRRPRSLPAPCRRRPAPVPVVFARCVQPPVHLAIFRHSSESLSNSSTRVPFSPRQFPCGASGRRVSHASITFVATLAWPGFPIAAGPLPGVADALSQSPTCFLQERSAYRHRWRWRHRTPPVPSPRRRLGSHGEQSCRAPFGVTPLNH